MKGIDTSNWSLVPSPLTLRHLWDEGYRFVIPGTQTGNDGKCYTAEQITAFSTAGFWIPAVYVFLYCDGRDSGRVTDAIKYGLPVWLDCEWDTTGKTPERNVENIQAAVNQLGSQCAGIYTGGWWWPAATRNSTQFSSLPLWDANYDKVPHIAPVAYGGFQAAYLHQYSSDGTSGFNCDLNYCEDSMIIGPGLEVKPSADGKSMVFVVQGVEVLKLGGETPGRIAKNFGGTDVYLRALDDGGNWLNGAEWHSTPGD